MTLSQSGLSFASQLQCGSSDIIRASWRRCSRDYQLQTDIKPPVAAAYPHDLSVSQGEIGELLSHSSAIIDSVRKVARDADRIVLVANADGIVVRSHADSPVSQDILRQGFAIGSILHERSAGTNGIGTCLASRQSVTVHAEAHFIEAFRGFTCAAAPVFSPDGRILAAVNISGRLRANTAEGIFAQHFIREAAQNMSLLLFKKKHRKDCIITLSAEPQAGAMSQALVATDESGRILGATPEGYALLCVADLQALDGRLIGDLCQTNLSNLKSLAEHSVRLQTPRGAIYGTAFWGERSTTAAVKPAAAPRPQSDIRPLDQVAGNDAAMQDIVRICRKIINRDIPVLLLGETGVGKDTLARAIHAESSRATKPYIAVNCAAIPPSLLASELFGYAPGTFTDGTKSGKIGKIVAADGGTLFLDEIGDMPLDLQALLLRVLEDRTVTPLGSTVAIGTDIKIICATHKDLPNLVGGGLFRKDLYYRIRGAQFTIPAVRDRSDFVTLVSCILQDEARSCANALNNISAQALQLLAQHAWPGNIRELRNVLRYAASFLGPDRELRPEHLPEYVLEGHTKGGQNGAARSLPGIAQTYLGETPPSNQTLRGTNLSAERARIVHALRTNDWNVTLSAEMLGISRSTLHRKLRQHSITPEK